MDFEKNNKESLLKEGGESDTTTYVSEDHPNGFCTKNTLLCLGLAIANVVICYYLPHWNKFTLTISIPCSIVMLWACWGFLFGIKKATIKVNKDEGQITVNFIYSFTGSVTVTHGISDLVDIVPVKYETKGKVDYAEIWLVFKEAKPLLFYIDGENYESEFSKIESMFLDGPAKQDDKELSKPCCFAGCPKRTLFAVAFVAIWVIAIYLLTKYSIITDD